MRKAPIEILHIVGGGAQNQVLNQFSANATGLSVIAGPVEATAIGNVLVQAMAKNEISSIKEGKELVTRSFPLQYCEPVNTEQWIEVYEKMKWIFASKH